MRADSSRSHDTDNAQQPEAYEEHRRAPASRRYREIHGLRGAERRGRADTDFDVALDE